MIDRTIGKYRILSRIGRGGTGIVYKALDQTLDREVAIKVLRSDHATADIMKRFSAEATILAKLNHPAIATVYELLRDEDDLFMVMEFVKGEPLEELAMRIGPMPPEYAVCIVDSVLSGLEHAHRAGVVHRDIKPANIMITASGDVKIMDFGIARVRGGASQTLDKGMVGTPAYMSPEQVRGDPIDGRADIYSTGVVFYRLLTAALPFTGETAVAILQKQISEAPRSLGAHRRDLPDWCDTIVQRALAKLPDNRFQTAEAFREALARATGKSSRLDLAAALAVSADAAAAAAASPATVALLASDGDRAARASVTAPAHAQESGETQPTVVLPAANPPRRTGRGARGRAPSRLIVIAASMVAILAALPLLWQAENELPAPPAPTAPAANLPVLTFDATALVASAGRQRDQDARLILGGGKVTIIAVDGKKQPLYSVPYKSVISIAYSRGSDPMRNSPKGPVPVRQSSGGLLRRLGISARRHWVCLETNPDRDRADRFVVMHVGDQSVQAVLAALEVRTGRAVQVVGDR